MEVCLLPEMVLAAWTVEVDALLVDTTELYYKDLPELRALLRSAAEEEEPNQEPYM